MDFLFTKKHLKIFHSQLSRKKDLLIYISESDKFLYAHKHYFNQLDFIFLFFI